MNLADEFDLCDDGNISSNKNKLLRVEAKTCNETPSKVWNMADR